MSGKREKVWEPHLYDPGEKELGTPQFMGEKRRVVRKLTIYVALKIRRFSVRHVQSKTPL